MNWMMLECFLNELYMALVINIEWFVCSLWFNDFNDFSYVQKIENYVQMVVNVWNGLNCV